MTHTYFSIDTYQKIPKNCQNKVNNKIEYLKLFSQGSDTIMFYHFLIGKRAKKAMNIQRMLHTKKTKDFFINTIQYINQNNLSDNQEIMAFLYGYICHYYLDLYTHPLIYYKGGKFEKDKKETYKYNALHQEIEYNIDLYMIKQREKTSPEKYKVYKNIFNIKNFGNELTTLIDDIIEKTYQYQNISKLYLSSIKYMKLFFRLINHDPTGIKLKIYQLIDKITPKSTIRLEELSYHHNFEKDLSYLNLEHKTWTDPWDSSKKYTDSFFDLYNKALEEAIITITKITDMLDKKELSQKELNNIFKDLSYTNGRPCNQEVEMKNFENKELKNEISRVKRMGFR